MLRRCCFGRIADKFSLRELWDLYIAWAGDSKVSQSSLVSVSYLGVC